MFGVEEVVFCCVFKILLHVCTLINEKYFSSFVKSRLTVGLQFTIYLFHAGRQVEYTFYIHEQPP
jgi:hypothetical protein